MASFHMEGEALTWFQDAEESGQFPTWDAFLQALLTRFGPTYDDPMEALMRLRHSSTVAEYTAQFESRSNRLRGIFERNRLSCFLTGLKDDLRLPVRMLNPSNLAAAFGLAKMQEEYILSSRRPIRSTSSSYSFARQQTWSHPGSSVTQKATPTYPSEIQSILTTFHTAFEEPSGLPPSLPQDHTIPLKHNQPINVRSYRYPYYQKSELEKIICELLLSGVIRPSQSPFSALVLLDRKADGSWRLCVD